MQYKITPDVEHALGFYVYAYIDPRCDKIFYVGKGVGARAVAHLDDQNESGKVALIREIMAAGLTPRIDILAHGLRDDLEASRVEAALIEALGIDNLTNIVRGRFSSDFPRRSLKDFIMESAVDSVDVIDPSILIRINNAFRYNMTDEEIYDATRGIWVIGKRRESARLAMAVFAGIIREVYEIESWHPAGSTFYKTRDQEELAKKSDKRWEFTGKVASASFRDRYLGRSVAHLFREGQQSPVVGINL
jgi:hypothetical protein